MIELYRRIWAVSGSVQVLLIILSLLLASLAAVPLQLQKDIINGLGETMGSDQLLLLCAAYLGVLVLSNVLKFAMQYRSSTLGEMVVKRIRYRLANDIAGSASQASVNRGRLVTMVASEAEQVGSFAGEAIASPLLQVGTLVSVIAYIAWTEPYLGLIISAVILPQAVIVLSLQKSINQLVASRVKLVRKASNEITSEDIDSARGEILKDFDRIYETRCHIFKLKLSMKFVNNLIVGVGITGILLLGGTLVINGKSDIGTVVAALTGLNRANEPWRELITFYRELSRVRVGYDLLLTPQEIQ